MKKIINHLANLNEEKKRIVNIIHKQGPIAKSSILALTGMKLSTLNRIMQQLVDYELIVESGIGESSGGRKPSLYDVNSKKIFICGIDLSRTYTRIIITDLKMNIIFRDQFTMNESHTPEKTLDKIAAVIHDALDKLGIDKCHLLGAGIGTVGPMDRSRGLMINPVNFPAKGWCDVPIGAILSDKLKCPVIIDNGANAAVLSEYLFGDGKKFGSIAYFNCGVGIRTGAITSGTVIRTMNGTEDSFGHMTIDVDGEPCSCGNFGCIECYSSISAIERNFITSFKKGRSTSVSKDIHEIGFIDICNAADQNDTLAKEVISGAAAIFGAGLANYINLLNPGLIILSGPLIKNSKLFYDTCTEIALKKHYSKGEDKVIFSRGGYFKDDAISVGAAAMVAECSLA